MTGAMYAAIGGLKSHMSRLNVIGNNVSNVNTYGYKAARMTFRESIYGTSRTGSNGGTTNGGNNPSQIGYGCSVGTIDLNMSPSTYAPTGVALDCYITGEGFFIFGDKLTREAEYDTTGGTTGGGTTGGGAAGGTAGTTAITGYTWKGGVTDGDDLKNYELSRVGDFFVDADGYICNGDNKIVYGFARVQNPNYIPKPTPAQMNEAKKNNIDITSETVISTQLVPLRVPLQAAEPTQDNGGKVVTTTGTGDDAVTTTTYRWEEGDPVYPYMNANGLNQYADPDYTKSKYRPVQGQDNTFGNGEGDKIAGSTLGVGKSLMEVAENTAENAVSNVMPCQMREMSIDSTGAIMGTANGKTVVIGYLAMANADNPNGVTHIGGPYYKAMGGAGSLRVSTAGLEMPTPYLGNKIGEEGSSPYAYAEAADTWKAGKAAAIDKVWVETSSDFQSQGLEASSTDLAQEFTDMISTQRGYQANTRIVTVTDSMLEELVNMKR